MKLYLVQHGDALPKDIDPDRPLSDRGIADVQRMASFVGNHLDPSRVLHSGKTRARQTAEILAGGRTIEAIDGIAPNDPVAAFAQRIAQWDDDLLVVGHLPFMARLAALLVAGSDEADIVTYQPGSIVCVESDEEDCWRIQWMVRPELLSSRSTIAPT